MADVTLPSLGESVTEGIITQWFKKVGDLVARDEPLFEVSTDKVDSEMPSPAAGMLVEIIAGEGDTVETGSRVAVIDESKSASDVAIELDAHSRGRYTGTVDHDQRTDARSSHTGRCIRGYCQ